MNITPTDIATAGILITTGITLYKIIFGQGKAKAREENYTGEIVALKQKDVEFESTIGGMKTDINEIKINQEIKHGELKNGIANLEINILKELRKANGH